jgi:predicted DNA-binding transcriptional regulator YafY
MAKHHLNRLELLDKLIRTKSTGGPKSLAHKLGVSERTIYEYLDILKSLGAPIAYSKTRQSYFYTKEGKFNFRFEG